MFEESIITIEDAKKYFRALRCSHFYMSRHSEERYEEYRQLNIPREIESWWVLEQFDEYYYDIMENKADPGSLWELHWRMYDLFAQLNTEALLLKILEVTRRIRDIVPVLDRVIISETINGRTVKWVRTGLIYNAYDAGKIETAKEFAELSLHFASYVKQEHEGKQRCINATRLCKEIKRELGFS